MYLASNLIRKRELFSGWQLCSKMNRYQLGSSRVSRYDRRVYHHLQRQATRCGDKVCSKEFIPETETMCPLVSRFGYGSMPIDTFLVGWTSIYQLFWGSLGTRVLTHPHLTKELSSEDADDPRRLHPFIALAARHPCNLHPRAPVHHTRLERSILKCIPSTNNVLPEVTVDVCMLYIQYIYIYLNNNQILSHIVKHMSLISLWQC